ncbi:MAG: hypothetical protein Q9221_003089 [Calogaya cf. arnoldii]
MLVDDEVIMNYPHATRRRRLQDLVTCGRGMAIVSKQKTVDFSSSNGPERLRTLFATAITHRWEGLVLKPSNEPYFSSRQNSKNGPPRGWIKLKKDYIPGLGDSADFAVVGAGYDASRAAQFKCPNLKWTHFHLGCLRNKKEVKEKNARPYIVVVGAIHVNAHMTKHLNQHGQFYALPFGSLQSRQDPFIIMMDKGVPAMSALFRKPFVLDVVGAGFDKEGNRDYYTLRFPRALKIHSDRDWKDSVSFDELQEMANFARTVPADTKAEVAGWEQQLDQVDRGTKGSHVPWDLSDDDVDIPDDVTVPPTAASTSKPSRRRSSIAPPMIRMDTQEMNDKEQRLDSGEVVKRQSQRSPISNWSDSNLPTPPKSSPAHLLTPVRRRQEGSDQSSTPYSRQALSSIQSTVSTDRSRKRSTADNEETPKAMVSKRRRVSPPIQRIKAVVGNNADKGQQANTHATQEIHKSEKASELKSFLIPKLSIGAAEALRSKTQSRIIEDIERTSPDRQTTQDEASTQDMHSTQQSLIDDWHLPDVAQETLPRLKVPDLWQSHIVLSADISGMPYLTEDLLTRKGGLEYQNANAVFLTPTAPAKVNPNPICKDDDRAAQQIIIFVEGRRQASSLEMMKFLVGRIPNDGSQIIWIFDWRLVEDMFARGVKNHNKLLDQRLIGRYWYGGDGELRWLTPTRDVRIVPQEMVEESKEMSEGRLDNLGAIDPGYYWGLR